MFIVYLINFEVNSIPMFLLTFVYYSDVSDLSIDFEDYLSNVFSLSIDSVFF